MLNDHLEHLAIPEQRIVGIEIDPVEDRQRVATNLIGVLDRLIPIQKRKVSTGPSGIVGRVVHLVIKEIVGRPPIQFSKKPDFLEIADMADVPHQGTHDRDLLTMDIVVAERSDQLPRPVAVKL
jgi:hypothetical protein